MKLLRVIAGIVGFILIWDIAVRLGDAPQYLLPGPITVARRFWFLVVKAHLLGHLWITVLEIVAGFVLGALAGLLAGGVFARMPTIERLATPLVLLLQTAPKIAIAPLLLLWLGIGPAPKIVLVAIVVFFPVMAGALAGLRYGDKNLRDLASVLRLTKRQVFLNIELPMAVPSILAGLRIATTLAMTAAVIGELMGASGGLGYLLSSGQENNDTAAVIAVVLLLSLIGWALHELVRLAERRIGAYGGSE
jgi:NitT/TauT family transport system permease protein